MKLTNITTFLKQLNQKLTRATAKPRQKLLTYIPKKRKKITWRLIARLALIGLAALIVFSGLTFAWYYKDLPRPGELRTRNASESTILYDRTGKQIYDISGEERRILIKEDEIPENIKKATVAIEDRNFYSHFGVDFRGLIRGIILKPLSGQRAQGGSTITQQYVKNAILSPKRSITRKIKEIIISLELEAVYSKEEILTLYLNEIPYGSNLYGVEAASQAYFGKSAKDGLTVSEAATLAAIPQAPTFYSPYGTHVDRLMARKNAVIDAMVRNGSITQEEADKAKKEAPLASKDFAQKRDNFPAPHFVMYVRELLVQKYGEDTVQRGGLRVTTTLDLDLQKKADDVVKEQSEKVLPRVKADNVALTAIDPKTGQLLAMVGSRDYFDRENEGNFNAATGSRQPGSAGKPIVYASLFKGKYSPASVLWDVDTDFNGYRPDNFDGSFHGPLTIRTSLGNSYNIPAVKALQITGIPKFLDTARDLGITTLDKKKDAGLSLALGGGEVKLVDLTAAYSVLANHGERHPLTAILKVEDSRKKVLDEWKPDPKQAIAPEIAYQVSDMLADENAKKPTFSRTLGLLTLGGRTVAVKTGTTNSYRDAWTVGYTPSLATGVWVGNNDNSEMERGGGSTAAAPFWNAFMRKALEGKPNEAFYRPDSLQEFTVDKLSGGKPTNASGELIKDWFASWQIPSKNDDVHTAVKVCKSNGKLATDNAPPDEIEERIFTRVRSEQPNNPAWENPVQAWAQQNGLNNPPPTEKCDLTFTDPKVKITSPSSGQAVNGIFTVTVDVTFPPNTSGTVSFQIDGAHHSTDDIAPFTATFDSNNLSLGEHRITATANADNGKSGSDGIVVNVSPDGNAPGDVGSVVLTPSTPGSVLASWVNPSDSDLKYVVIYVSQSSGIRGSKNTAVNASAGSHQSTTLSGLVSGIPNYVTFLTVDKYGNESTTTTQHPVTPL